MSATTVFNSITNLALYSYCLFTVAPDQQHRAWINAVGDDSYIALTRDLTNDDVVRFDATARAIGHPMAAGGGVRYIGCVGYCSNIPWPCRPMWLAGVRVGHIWAGKVGQSLMMLLGAFSQYSVDEARWIVADNARMLLLNNDHVPIVRTFARHVARLSDGFRPPSARWVRQYREKQYAWAHFDEHHPLQRPVRCAEGDERVENVLFALYGEPPGHGGWSEYEAWLDARLERVETLPFLYEDPVVAHILAVEGDGPVNPRHQWSMEF